MPPVTSHSTIPPAPSGNPADTPVQIGRIRYVNVDPIYYGLENGMAPSWLKIIPAAPSALNRMMAEAKLDISPVSTGAYVHHTGPLDPDPWLILPDLSISCHGPVMSVLLASRYPLDDLDGRNVVLTDESGTAVLLLKLIFATRGIQPRMKTATIGEASPFNDAPDAVLVIGDSALTGGWKQKYRYLIDLGDVWFQLSGLPIVFAVWVVRKAFADAHAARVARVIDLFRDSQKEGQVHLDKIITASTGKLNLPADQVTAYFRAMEYDLDENKQRALKTFFDGLYAHQLIEREAPLSFFG
jgi:chorismate dehydratase